MNELNMNKVAGLLTLSVMIAMLSLSMMGSRQSSASIKQEIIKMMVRLENMIGQIEGLVFWLSGYDRVTVTDICLLVAGMVEYCFVAELRKIFQICNWSIPAEPEKWYWPAACHEKYLRMSQKIFNDLWQVQTPVASVKIQNKPNWPSPMITCVC